MVISFKFGGKDMKNVSNIQIICLVFGFDTNFVS